MDEWIDLGVFYSAMLVNMSIFAQDQAVLIMIVLQYILESGIIMPLAFIF